MFLFDCVVHRFLLPVFPAERVLVSDTQNCILPVLLLAAFLGNGSRHAIRGRC
jgi:hypothetical protein